jgi:hypothetical protein
MKFDNFNYNSKNPNTYVTCHNMRQRNLINYIINKFINKYKIKKIQTIHIFNEIACIKINNFFYEDRNSFFLGHDEYFVL